MTDIEEFKNKVLSHFEEQRLNRKHENAQLDRIQTMLDKNIEPTATVSKRD